MILGEINTLLAYCNRKFVVWSFFYQKNAQTVWMAMKCRIINFDAIFLRFIDVYRFKVMIIVENVLILNKPQAE